MAKNRRSELPGYKGFKGADNTSGEATLPGGAVREAENVDFRTDGRARRRQGSTLKHTGTAVHSLYGWNGGHVWAETTNLYFRFGAPIAGLPTALVTGLRPREPISYTEIGEDLFWSNGRTSGIIKADRTTQQWGLASPIGVPTLTANAVGSYVAGRYQVTITYIDADGRESGAPGPMLITLQDNQGIDLTNIPQPLDDNVTTIAVFVSDPDGEVLFHHSDLPDGTTTATLYQQVKGEQCSTLFMDQTPAGHIVRYANGRLISVDNQTIYYSQPLRYGLSKVHEDYIRSAKRVTLLEPVSDGAESGFFYADDKRTYYVDGPDPGSAQIGVVYPVGAVEGSSTFAPGTDLGLDYSGHVPIWLAKNGRPVAGIPGGQVIILNDRYVADDFERGAALYRESDTIKQILIAATGKQTTSGLAAADSAVASVHFAPQLLTDSIAISDTVVDTVNLFGEMSFLNSAGTVFLIPKDVLDSDGNTHSITEVFLDSDGNEHTVI